MKASKKMEDVFDLCIDELKLVFKGDKSASDITKIAACTIGTYSRILATELHETVLRYQVQRSLNSTPAGNRDELKALQATI